MSVNFALDLQFHKNDEEKECVLPQIEKWKIELEKSSLN